MKPIIDRVLGIAISKKLMVWAVGTALVIYFGDITDNWLILSGIYLGIQGIIDAFKEKLKAGGGSMFSGYTQEVTEDLEK